MQRVLAIVLATSASACSFAFARVPSERDRRGHLNCEMLSPPADVVLATVATVMTGYFIATNPGGLNGFYANHDAPDGMIHAIITGLAVTYIGSAIYGYRQRARCRRVNAEPGSPAPVAGTSSP